MKEAPPALFPVLIVDDEPRAIQGVRFVLRTGGITSVLACDDARQVLTILDEHTVGAVLLDLRMPHVSGEELLDEITAAHPDVPVIIVTAANEVDVAVRCMKAGAFDYMVKPVEENRLISGVRRALELREVRAEYGAFRDRVLAGDLEHPEAFSAIVTRNNSMWALFQYMEAISTTRKPVLISGETGVGKDLAARALHTLSGRPGKFVALNVAGFDDSMFSDALFGHVKGAYTGADRVRGGLVEQAAGGTLFLDEIGDMSPVNQVRLLRVVQDGEYFPLGADVPKRTDARLIVATNRDLLALRKAGTFRADLYYRLKTHHVHLPPLRERTDDIPLLLDHFLEKSARALNKKTPTPPRQLYTLLATYSFPGNVRELETMVFDAVSRHHSRVLSMDCFVAHLDDAGAQTDPASVEDASVFALFDRLPTLREVPRLLIMEAMNRANGNQTIAARLLGITQSGLNKALKRSGLS